MTDDTMIDALPPATENAESGSGFLNAPWPVAAIELLSAKWKKGVSARAIAELLCDLGHPATKNSVLGKARRLGLGVHDNAIWTKDTLRIKPKPIVGMVNDKGCRWPIGDPGQKGFRFCEDAGVVPGKPYCELHAKIAYRKPEPHEAVPGVKRRVAVMA